jgi:DNA repair exonuclease SbcCD ATPase subunit
MRIDEFLISRYGPLKETKRIRPGDFTLFYGPNENGKTLTIDAILKFLFGKNVKTFEKIHRVEEEPHGYIIIRKNNHTLKFPEKGGLTDLTGIKPEDARNIFVIRDSDLALYKESQHYRSLTDKLTGMRTRQIEDIIDRLLDIGQVTESGLFTNREEKIRERMRQAEDLLEEIRQKKKEIQLEKVNAQERELAALTASIHEVQDKIELYSQAEKREHYQKGKQALALLKEARLGLDAMDIFQEEEAQNWLKYERDIQNETKRKNQLNQELKQEILEKKSLEDTVSQLKREFDLLDRTYNQIEQNIKPEIKNFAAEDRKTQEMRMKERLFSRASAALFAVAVLSMLAVILGIEKIIFLPLMGLAFIGFIGFGAYKFVFVKKRSKLAAWFESIKLDLNKHKISGDNIEELYISIQEFEERWYIKKRQLEDKQNQLRLQQSRISDLQNNDLPQAENIIRNAAGSIQKIKDKTGMKSLSEYREKIKERGKKHNTIQNQIRILTDRFGKDFDKLAENIREWEKDILRLQPYRESALNIEYRQEDYDRLKQQKYDLEINKQSLESQNQEFQKKLSEIETEANRILGPDIPEYLPCKTSVDLKEIEKQIQNFISSHNERKEIIQKAKKIFEKIKLDEEEKITRLFGRESSVSKYLVRITCGLYQEVNFDPELKKVVVTNKQNAILDAEKLSGGAYDQLYLSIRLGLGENLLSKRQPGFFILDDPFIKADPVRLREQMAVLKHIAGDGWQILYFSAKEEVKHVLDKDIQAGTVDLVSLPGLT